MTRSFQPSEHDRAARRQLLFGCGLVVAVLLFAAGMWVWSYTRPPGLKQITRVTGVVFPSGSRVVISEWEYYRFQHNGLQAEINVESVRLDSFIRSLPRVTGRYTDWRVREFGSYPTSGHKGYYFVQVPQPNGSWTKVTLRWDRT